MANGWYRKGAEKVCNQQIAYLTDVVKAVFVDAADYTPDQATHDALADIPVGARHGAPQTLASKTVTDGFFKAANLVFPNVTGDPSEYIAFYVDSGVEATSWLLWLFDTATGLPVTFNGGNANVNFNAAGICSL